MKNGKSRSFSSSLLLVRWGLTTRGCGGFIKFGFDF